jgi:NTP pyrophosphatase (non-canonical NTP hydrolase)
MSTSNAEAPRSHTAGSSVSWCIGALCDEAYRTALYHGFHQRPVVFPPDGIEESHAARHLLSLLMLITTEVAEAAEAVRKGTAENLIEELADICIRVFDFAGGLKSGGLPIDFAATLLRKMEYNKTRPWKNGGKRA